MIVCKLKVEYLRHLEVFMSGNIGNFGGFPTNNPSSPAISGVGNAQGTSNQKGSSLFISTIQKSELDALVAMLAAGFPLLPLPGITATNIRDLNTLAVGGVSRSEIEMQIEQTKNNIINSMWDSFLKTLHEISERAKKEDILRWTSNADRGGPKSASEYYAFLMSVSSSQKAEELSGGESALASQFNTTFHTWMVAPIQSNTLTTDAVSNKGYPDSSFVAGCVACSSDVVRTAIGSISPALGYQLSVSPIADAVYAVGPTSGLPADYQAAAALVAALLNGGAMYKATSDTINKAASTSQPPQDLDFAINYAQNIKAIVTHKLDDSQSVNPQRAGQNNMIRLTLSVMALNMLYRAAYGGMTSKEFASVLQGNTGDIPGTIKPLIDHLASLINSYLPSDPSARSESLVSLYAYVDGKNSVDSMLSTTRMLKELLGTDDINGKRIGSV